jgi:hypothetical protein
VKPASVVVAVALLVTACSSSPPTSNDTTIALLSATTVSACVPAPDAVCRGVDLAGADLAGANLVGIDLRRASLRGADLTGANLTQSILIGADLGGAKLDGAVFVRATADEADFSGSSVRGALFSNASLREARFDGVDTSLALATGADTRGSTPDDVVAGFLDDDVESSDRGEAVGPVVAVAGNVTPLLEELTFRVSRDRVAPTKASRRYAYVALAMLAAALPKDPFVASVNDLDDFPMLTDDVHPAIAAVVAGSVVARALFTIPADDVTLAEVADDLAARMIGDLGGDQLRSTFAHGRATARVVLARADRDGFTASQKVKAPEADAPGEWVPTSPNFQPPIDAGWGTVTPFFSSTAECTLAAPSVGPEPQSPYQMQADEVADVAANLTEEQKSIARFWDDGRGRTGTPSGHWLVIALKLAEQQQLPFDTTLSVVARATLAMADAFIGVWREKYKWMVERPITVLQRTDPDWSSYLVTPAFPEYPSGHSAVSRAAADVLAGHFGEVAFDDPGYGVTEQSRNQFNVSPRSFESLRAAADEASISRLFGGIHYAMGLDAGKKLGSCIAAGVLATGQ